MKTQLFTPCQVKRGDKMVGGMSIACGKCPQIGRIPMNSFAHDDSSLLARKATRQFEAEGWFIGSTPGKHRCPTCRSIERKIALVHPAPPVKETVAVSAAPTPAPMGRQDRRIIFDKLNDVYADEATGYRGDWTDKKVAEDLGVPRAWVALVREENFGSLASNAAISETNKQATELLAKARQVLEIAERLTAQARDLQASIDGVGKELPPLRDLVDRTERRLFEIEKQVRP